jgi:hypothetical protein
MTAPKDELLKAIDLALNDAWAAAHGIVQGYDADATASWIHAVLHKLEGDTDNSRYWYRRAGKLDCFAAEPRAELARIRTELMDATGAPGPTNPATAKSTTAPRRRRRSPSPPPTGQESTPQNPPPRAPRP